MHYIPGTVIHNRVDGKHYVLKLKTKQGKFTLKPLEQPETYSVLVTSNLFPGSFKNSGYNTIGWFTLTRYPGRNSVVRPQRIEPVSGNIVLMWDKLVATEQQKAIEFAEKLIRAEVPRLEAAT